MNGKESWIYQVNLDNVTFPKNGKIPTKSEKLGQNSDFWKVYVNYEHYTCE